MRQLTGGRLLLLAAALLLYAVCGVRLWFHFDRGTYGGGGFARLLVYLD